MSCHVAICHLLAVSWLWLGSIHNRNVVHVLVLLTQIQVTLWVLI